LSNVIAKRRMGTAVQTASLQKRAYAEIKRLIVTGEIAPGAFLSERQLAARLSMSKTPVHVALERLAAEGFIDISPQRGAVVRDVGIQDVLEHYEFRQAIESFVVTQLAGRLTPAQVGRLEDNLTEQESCVAEGVSERCVETDTAFHLLLCEFLGNRLITQAMDQLRAKIHQAILRATAAHPRRLTAGIEEHRQIVRALVADDPTRAAALVREHLNAGKQTILNPARATPLKQE
jgi:GntR family transcriptional regulator, rspAB operon transcriptional repressor